jgi:hypothetical protein
VCTDCLTADCNDYQLVGDLSDLEGRKGWTGTGTSLLVPARDGSTCTSTGTSITTTAQCAAAITEANAEANAGILNNSPDASCGELAQYVSRPPSTYHHDNRCVCLDGEDSNDGCNSWAASGECDNNPGFMLASCCAACQDRMVQDLAIRIQFYSAIDTVDDPTIPTGCSSADFSESDGYFYNNKFNSYVGANFYGIGAEAVHGEAACCPVRQAVVLHCSSVPTGCIGSWGEWSQCTDGTQTKAFTVTTQPSDGGLACPADLARICGGNYQQIAEYGATCASSGRASITTAAECTAAIAEANAELGLRSARPTDLQEFGGKWVDVTFEDSVSKPSGCYTQGFGCMYPSSDDCESMGHWLGTFNNVTSCADADGCGAVPYDSKFAARNQIHIENSPIRILHCSAAAAPPQNCVGRWSKWGACSDECGGGTRTRLHTVTARAMNGGTACSVDADASETKSCSEWPQYAAACEQKKKTLSAGRADAAPGTLFRFLGCAQLLRSSSLRGTARSTE